MKLKGLELTYEELTEKCRKQEEYIKKLEEKLKTSSDTEKLETTKPDYDELVRVNSDLYHQLSVLIDENNSLRWSLTMAYKEMTAWKNRSENWQENYYKEHKRANKLYDELERKTDEN